MWTIMQGRSLRRLPAIAGLACLFCSTIGLLILLTALSPATAQVGIEAQAVAQQVYKLDPDLPLENQYVNQSTGKVSETNTLISRLVRYHTFTKGRSPLYRLDWKLTLADYLGVNDRISVSAYPGADSLRSNPAQSDIAIIQKLTRTQRDRLVQALVGVFSQAAAAATPSTPSGTPAPSGTPEPSGSTPPETPQSAPAPNASPRTVSPQAPQTAPAPRREPRPGDAELLLAP